MNSAYNISELEVGKAAEHMVVADLILQGYSAYLSDQGLSYDVVVDCEDRLHRIQVKATTVFRGYDTRNNKDRHPLWRFHLRKGKNSRRFYETEFDYVACVAIPAKKIAYLGSGLLLARTGRIKTLFEFRDRDYQYKCRVYPNGKSGKLLGMFIDDYARFVV